MIPSLSITITAPSALLPLLPLSLALTSFSSPPWKVEPLTNIWSLPSSNIIELSSDFNWVESIVQPPISPAVAVTVPENVASPALSNEITVLSVEPCLFIISKFPDESISNLDLSFPTTPTLSEFVKDANEVPLALSILIPVDSILTLAAIDELAEFK